MNRGSPDQGGVMRLRCKLEMRDPRRPARHYAIDVRTPLAGFQRQFLTDVFEHCCCGSEMVVLSGSPDPWKRG